MKRFIIILASALTLFACVDKAQLQNLRCEYQVNPINIDCSQPRFSWEYNAAEDFQKAYTLDVAATDDFTEILWTSGRVEDDATLASYQGGPLESFTTYWWRLTAEMESGATLVSAPQKFETAMMSGYEWQAQWISDGRDRDFAPAPMVRKSFKLAQEPAQARLYISAAAYYRLSVNGEPISDITLDPGYTVYSRTNLYSTYDITPYINIGENVIGAVLGNGFYNEIEPVATWDFEKAYWRGRARMIAELHITYEDGTKEVILTDPSWKCAIGPYLSNNIYSGDIYDARLEIEGWDGTRLNDSDWTQAVAVDAPSDHLVSQQNPPVRECEVLDAVGMQKFSDTLYVFDFGRNISGVSSLSLDCESGIKVTLRHGELLKEDGMIQMGNIDIYFYPKQDFEIQTDIYYTKEGEQCFSPCFTYHGFRYVEVSTSKPVELTAESLKARFIHTDVEPVGSFECSNELINKINAASKLSYLDNLVSIPTDCPQREKNGWTADANLAIDLALLNYDGIKFYEKWVNDMIDSQLPDGNVPGIVPTAGWGYDDWIGPVWASAFFMIPDALAHYYGDTKAIEMIYPTCAKYLEYLGNRLDPDGTVTYGIGDWVYYNTATPTDYSTTLFYWWQNVLMGRYSDILGLDGAKYREKADFLSDLIQKKHFNTDTCLYGNGSQAGQAMALYFGIVPEQYREQLAASLNQMIADNGYYLDFGSVGSKFAPRVLADYGYEETVMKMLLKEDAPSWGGWISQGLTTLAERWALDFEGFRDSSANHVFLGDISAWMVKYLAGIRYENDYEGNCDIRIQPCFVEELDWAKAEYKSPKGLISSSWKREGDRITLDVTVPANTKATVCFGGRETEIEGGSHSFTF